ncbi:MAG: hypothetical protein H0X24_24410, partial [Ktedonobacterales bacterium]|nr:hypothetical protein [Ktedonobacterales bacterium]
MQQRQRGDFGYHRAFMQTPEAFFQIDEESYVVRWLNYFSPHSTLYITDRATGARVAELPTTHVRAHLTVPEGDFDWDITGSVCFDAQG